MKTIDFSYFIERFNSGEMDEDEKRWFMKELHDNEKLRKEAELRNKTDSFLRNQDLLKLRSKLNEIEKKRAETEKTRKSGRAVNIKYAAVFAGILILGSIAFLYNRKTSTDEIISKYYAPYEVTASSRSGEIVANNNADFNMAMDYYKIHDYKNAALYFSKVVDNEPDNMHSVFLNGMSNFEIQNYPVAEVSFSKVIADDNNYFIDHAQWYLALCYLKTNEKLKAVEQLTIIEKSGTIYRKDAKKILRGLK